MHETVSSRPRQGRDSKAEDEARQQSHNIREQCIGPVDEIRIIAATVHASAGTSNILVTAARPAYMPVRKAVMFCACFSSFFI